MTRDTILEWLRERDPERLRSLWARADAVRRRAVGDTVHLRGLVEFSNRCARQCLYCGLRAENSGLQRYRMGREEILRCADTADAAGLGTLVLQSGEDPGMTVEWLADVVRQTKARTGLAVTLSVGERAAADLRAWREAGADRYLLRFETSNAALFRTIHPPCAARPAERFTQLRTLRELGYETGSGVMVGIPGQTIADVADDLEAFRRLDLDMIGVGPFVPHPATPLGAAPAAGRAPAGEQVPNTASMACTVVALARLLCPLTNIPSTTALATLTGADGRGAGLRVGANVLMPNITPEPYRGWYEIYPAKSGAARSAEREIAVMRETVLACSRVPGMGRGDAPNYARRAPTALAAGS